VPGITKQHIREERRSDKRSRRDGKERILYDIGWSRGLARSRLRQQTTIRVPKGRGIPSTPFLLFFIPSCLLALLSS
jgi:hypothetical protein